MPKLKVPTAATNSTTTAGAAAASAAKPAKKQLTLQHFQKQLLRSPGSAIVDGMERHHHLGRVPSISPKKQNGLKPAAKAFVDAFGDSEDEVSGCFRTVAPF